MCALPAPHPGTGQGRDTTHRSRGRRAEGKATQIFGTRSHSPVNFWVPGCGHTLIFRGQIAECSLFPKAIESRLKAFLPAHNKWCGLRKVQRCISPLMKAMAITYFKTCFKIHRGVGLYWPKNAKQA